MAGTRTFPTPWVRAVAMSATGGVHCNANSRKARWGHGCRDRHHHRRCCAAPGGTLGRLQQPRAQAQPHAGGVVGDRCRAQAPPRPDPEPGVDRAGLCLARARDLPGRHRCSRQRLFLMFPATDATWTEVLEEPGSQRATFDLDVSHADVEQLVGETVTVPAPEMCTAPALGGSRHPLLALIPAEEEQPSMLDEMQVVAVADLRWPHNPAKCAHLDRFNAIREFYDKGFDGHVPASAHFFLSLDADHFAACPYHGHDWVAIAEASVDLLKGARPTASHPVRPRRRAAAAREPIPDHRGQRRRGVVRGARRHDRHTRGRRQAPSSAAVAERAYPSR